MQRCYSFLGIVIFKFMDLKVGNINQLRNKSVDIFGIKDQETIDSFALSQETFTGGVTPAVHLTINTIN